MSTIAYKFSDLSTGLAEARAATGGCARENTDADLPVSVGVMEAA
ncbi:MULTISPECIES: hypothetical protein [Rhizobium]|uniref:Uncharacterized protein n=1 Tax=Rhizobium rhododendri TaxID=2506430 RepID=A0ABY8IPX7_9HYPH|nr:MULTISPECIES: hypothetical protein [Rhizobium]WFS25361.1 hypothetical protein PR018_24375 [Rhizobium rhododendri]